MKNRLSKMFSTVMILALVLAALPIQSAQAATPTELFFSEYIEGSSNNKALEIYNGTGAAIDLGAGAYIIQMYFNGATTVGLSINLTGTVADGDVFVVTNQSAGATLLAVADLITTATNWYNGDDAVVLRKGGPSGTILDVIGQIGFDPGSEWGSGLVSTADNTLSRKADVCAGDMDGSNAFDPSVEWDGYATDTFDGLGSHTANCGEPEINIIITEIMYDPNSAEDNWEWIEIYNAGSSSVDLTGFVVDDNNSVAHGAANIAGGILATGQQAVLYNVDDVSAPDFGAAWGNVNLIPVTNWNAMALNNTGDQISLWKSFTDYSGDNVNHTNAIDTVTFNSGAGFPDPVGASIYLTDLGVDNNVGSNWATSTVGGATPLFSGYQSLAAGGNIGTDVGSPGTPVALVNIIINEIDSDTPGTDALEFVELYDGGSGNTSLDGFVVVFYNGNGDVSYAAFDLDGHSTNSNGYFLLGNAGVTPSPSITFAGNLLQNGADAVAIYEGNASDFPNGTAVTTANLVDAVVYDTDDADDPGLLVLLNTGQPQVNEAGGGDSAAQSIQRCPNGSGDARNTDTYTQGSPTPGSENCPPPPPEVCGDPITHFIHEIQGNGFASPLVGVEVAIEAIVVGDFQNNASVDNGELNGFYVQEEDAEADADAATSEGIFVFAPGGIDVSVGDKVRVRGTVTEFNGLTEIGGVTTLLNCSTGNSLPSQTPVTLPVNNLDDFEKYEGMLVTFPQALVISEYFNYERFGEMVLALPLDGETRPFTGTAIDEPGAPANARSLANSLRRITLDDGRGDQNPASVRHPNGLPFALDNRFRGGDTVQNVVGVMDYAFGLYRIQPTGPADYTSINPRPVAPEPVGGNVRVAAMNTLNYFITPDYPTGNPLDNKCGPLNSLECRGWDSDQTDEFTRQRAKLLAALTGLDADVIGLNELENSTGVEPLADIVAGLPGYAYIDTGPIGTDAIKVGMIYRPGVVTPVGDYKILDSSVDPRFIDTKSRPVLAQTFEENATGARFTVAVNHLKSKGSDCNDVGDPDAGDGQGNCNLTRTLAAQALVDWLAADPTGSGDVDTIIIGDLNSYGKEDPIDVILAGGYTNLINKYQGTYAYSYVFDGQFGYLDHALANFSLTPQVTGAADWHINADEPDILDYDTSFKPPAQDALYEPNAYRSSDHDPVIVGLDLLHYNFTGFFPPIANAPAFNMAKAGNSVPVKFSLDGDQGLDIFLAGYPLSRQIACDSNAPSAEVEQTVNAGGSTLTYDPSTDQYTYVWKTEKSWAGTCRQLVVVLKDGSIHIANFQFK